MVWFTQPAKYKYVYVSIPGRINCWNLASLRLWGLCSNKLAEFCLILLIYYKQTFIIPLNYPVFFAKVSQGHLYLDSIPSAASLCLPVCMLYCCENWATWNSCWFVAVALDRLASMARLSLLATTISRYSSLPFLSPSISTLLLLLTHPKENSERDRVSEWVSHVETS